MSNLKDILADAYRQADAQKSCSHFVWHVIKGFKPAQPYMTANALVRWLGSNSADWEPIANTESQTMAGLANKGVLIVGGRDNGSSNGHVIVVSPGDLKPLGGFNYLHNGKMVTMKPEGSYARAMSHSMSNWPGATSNGDKTIRDSWGASDFAAVKFWIYKPSKPAQ